jgi:hypothetical protein
LRVSLASPENYLRSPGSPVTEIFEQDWKRDILLLGGCSHMVGVKGLERPVMPAVAVLIDIRRVGPVDYPINRSRSPRLTRVTREVGRPSRQQAWSAPSYNGMEQECPKSGVNDSAASGRVA